MLGSDRRSRLFISVLSGWQLSAARHLAMAVSLVLAVTVLASWHVAPAAAAPKPKAAAKAPSEAADIPSARVAARLSGKRVEALSERSETSTTWVNPNGSLTSELSAGPTRFKQNGQWVDVDVTFAEQADGSVASRAHPNGLKLGAAGGTKLRSLAESGNAASRDLVTLGSGEQQVTLGWKGGLPKPVLEGAKATYPGAVPGADLIVEATRTGFEQYVELKQRPADAAYTYTLPLRAPGLKVAQQADGSVVFTSKKTGARKAVMPAPVMWDATVDDRSGEHTRNAPVAMTVVQRGPTVDLVLTPDAKFLADSKTKYPVTVDPSTGVLGNVFDTYVQRGETVDRSTSTDLLIGYPNATNPDGTTVVARSFITWNTAPIADSLVMDAKLKLFNYHSWNCSAREWQVWPANQASTATRWSNQPAMLTSPAFHKSTETKGGIGCNNDGYVTADVTGLVTVWANSKAAKSGMGLKAGSETDATFWKRFHSGNAAANLIPKLEVTYNFRPLSGKDLKAGPPFFAYNGVYHVNTTEPTLEYRTGDVNGDKLRAVYEIQNTAGARVGDLLGVQNVPAGQIASVKVPAGLLTNGSTYKFRVINFDYVHWETVWSPLTTFVVDTTAPSAPTAVGSTDYPSGQWVKGAGQPGTFTATPPVGTDHNSLEWSLDGDTWTKVVTSGAAGAKTFSVIPPKDGSHTLQVRTVDKADNASEPVEYVFHAGPGGFDSPSDGQRTARRVPLVAEADAGRYDKVSFSWRRSDADTWTPIPPAHVRKGDEPLSTWPVSLVNGKNPPVVWTATDTVNPDGAVQVRAEFTGPSNATGATEPLSIVVDRNADEAASTDVGPGAVNSLTGEYALAGSDASFFGMSVTRTASSRQPDAGAKQQGQVPIFGKEWVSGVTAETVQSTTHIRKTSDTSVDVVSEDGSSTRFTSNKTKSGWVPEPGAEDLTLSGSFGGSFTLSDAEGGVTTFAKVTAVATTWQAVTSLRNGLDNSTTKTVSEAVTVDGKTLARPKRLIAPTSAATGVACETNPATRGCRVLEFGYATTTTATGSTLGDFAGQTSEIRLWATNPGAAAATVTVVAKYAYDSAGRLREAWDPRVSPPLKIAYGYDAAGRVTTLTPPGQLPWTFNYGKAGDAATAGDGMLLSASRPTLKPGTVDEVDGQAVTSVVYDVPLTGDKAPYKMGATEVKAWGQSDAPTDASAVFPADAVPSSHIGSELGSGDYRRATIGYLNASGQEVNVASPGGHISATEFDTFGNQVRDLSASNRALALGGSDGAKTELDALGISGLASAERAHLLSDVSVFDEDGIRQLEQLGPLRRIGLERPVVQAGVSIAAAGTEVAARSRTVHEYDTGRPTDGTAVVKNQVTKVTAGAQLREYPDVQAEVRVSTTEFDWTQGTPTRTVQDPGGLAIARRDEYDAQGRVFKTLMPNANGTDAGTTLTRYYTADGTGPCGGRPEWADLLCQTGPAGGITGGGSNPSQLPTETVEYDRHGSAARTVETANGDTRITAAEFDIAGRPSTATVSGGLGAAVPASTTEYDPATGQAVKTTSPTGGTITRGYDKLGRQLVYIDADGGTTRREYDSLGRPVKVSDSVPSTITYGYDNTVEPRGLPVTVTDSVAGTFTARFDADGSVAEEKSPGGYTMRQSHDPAGAVTSRVYSRDADSTVVLTDAATNSVHGQRVTRVGGAGQVAAQQFRYDAAGRLSTVEDTADTVCTRRSYVFDKHSNRQSKTTATSVPNAACPTTGGTAVNHSYDSADRLVDAGYSYDAFGRTTAAPDGLTVSYFANDLAQTQTAGNQRQTWTLDAGNRFRAWTVETNIGGTWTAAESKRNHYDNDSDSPRWIVENATTGEVTRNVASLGGGLSATTTKTGGTTLQLTNLHGDINLVLPLDTSVAPTVLDTDEYGNPRANQERARYGWLGGYQRAGDTPGGVFLMGVRLYNPQTGRFLSVDPVASGNDNAYTYPVDPINQVDLDGQMWKWAAEAGLSILANFLGGMCVGTGVGVFICGAIVGALVGAFTYTVMTKLVNKSKWNWGKFSTAVVVGLLAGAAGPLGGSAQKALKALGKKVVPKLIRFVRSRLKRWGFGKIAGLLGTIGSVVVNILTTPPKRARR